MREISVKNQSCIHSTEQYCANISTGVGPKPGNLTFNECRVNVLRRRNVLRISRSISSSSDKLLETIWPRYLNLDTYLTLLTPVFRSGKLLLIIRRQSQVETSCRQFCQCYRAYLSLQLCDEPGAVVFSCLFIVQCCLR